MRPPKINHEIQYAPLRTQVYDIFPTPLIRGEMNLNHEKVANDCRELIRGIRERRPDEVDPQRYYTTYFFEEERRTMEDFPWYTDFANQLKDTYVEFIKTQWFRRVNHLSRHNIHLFAWASDYTEGQHHSMHNHQNVLISGTYYPLSEGNISPITFQSPHLQSQFIHSYQTEEIKLDMPNAVAYGTPSSHQTVGIRPVSGEVLMWPANILHSVEGIGHGWSDMDKQQHRRIAISFNLNHVEPQQDMDKGTEMSYEFL